MNTSRMWVVLVAGWCAMVTVVSASSTANAGEKWKTYLSPDFGFEIAYPASMTFSPGRPLAPPQHSMFPICDETTVACFQYNGIDLNGTAIQAAGVSVNVLRDRKTQSDCDKIETSSGPARTANIRGTLFRYAETFDGAMGSSRSMTDYRTFYQHVCIEVALVVAKTEVPSGETEDENRFRPVNPRAWQRISADSDRMLQSFTLVGPVKDGPDWDVSRDPGCAESFEYPAEAKVRQVVEYTNAGAASNSITCEQAFNWKGRLYSVAVKVNLLDKNAVDRWLSLSGYPALDRMRMVAKQAQFTEYRNRNFACVRFKTEVLIFTVSTEDGRPVSSTGDRIFAHLLGSLRVR